MEAKFIFESENTTAKMYGASFAGAFGAEGTKLSVNAQLELPINQSNDGVFTVIIKHLVRFKMLYRVPCPKACIEAGGQYPRSSFVDRRNLLKNGLEAIWNATVGFGDMCGDHQQHQLTFKVQSFKESARNEAIDSFECLNR